MGSAMVLVNETFGFVFNFLIFLESFALLPAGS